MYHNVKLQISEDDSILIDYDLFFDDQKENCKGFVIDEEDELEKVLYVLSKLKKQFVDSTVYVCAYGEEIINNKGEEIIYAECDLDTSSIERVLLNIVVRDKNVEKTIQAVQKAACTGEIGDGRIFVIPVEDTVRIRTGERGDIALYNAEKEK